MKLIIIYNIFNEITLQIIPYILCILFAHFSTFCRIHLSGSESRRQSAILLTEWNRWGHIPFFVCHQWLCQLFSSATNQIVFVIKMKCLSFSWNDTSNRLQMVNKCSVVNCNLFSKWLWMAIYNSHWYESVFLDSPNLIKRAQVSELIDFRKAAQC